MGRLPTHKHNDDNGVRKGPWSAEEDQKLIAYIKRYGIWNWTHMPGPAGLARTGKSCRLRWMNYLRPNIKHGNFTKEEEDSIITLQQRLGNRWSAIAAELPGRTDNEVKNYWNTRLKKRFSSNNIKTNTITSTPNLQAAANVNCVGQKPPKEITDSMIPLVPKKGAQDDLRFGGLHIESFQVPVPNKLFSTQCSSSSSTASLFCDIYRNNQTCLVDVDDEIQNLCFQMFQVEDICMKQNLADIRGFLVPSQEWSSRTQPTVFEDFLFDL